MSVKNLMEDKQLDFSQPLLRVRRFTSPVDNKKSDPKISRPVRKPGTVPFVWEKAPGQPKEEVNLQTKVLQQPSIAPKLPPGRAFAPAAKAVASETVTPPYATTRKQPMAPKPPRQIKKQPLYLSSPNKYRNHAQDDRLPGMKNQAQKPAYSVRRRQATSSETENEAAGEKGSTGMVQTEEFIKMSGSTQKSCSGDCQKLSGASLFGQSQLVHQEKRFLGKNYRVSSIDPLKNFQELLTSENITQESGSAEKTLCVDFVHEDRSYDSCLLDRMALPQCLGNDLEILVRPEEMEKTPSVNGFRRDQDLIRDCSKLTCLNYVTDMESQVKFKLSYQETSNTFTNSKVTGRKKIDLESHPPMKLSNRETSGGPPLAPPLPKAPSDSWLKRTLPTVSLRNSSSRTRSCLGTCNYVGTQASTASFGYAKWETMVRSSNAHHGQFSEEQLPEA